MYFTSVTDLYLLMPSIEYEIHSPWACTETQMTTIIKSIRNMYLNQHLHPGAGPPTPITRNPGETSNTICRHTKIPIIHIALAAEAGPKKWTCVATSEYVIKKNTVNKHFNIDLTGRASSRDWSIWYKYNSA